jgi:hypothetical protein
MDNNIVKVQKNGVEHEFTIAVWQEMVSRKDTNGFILKSETPTEVIEMRKVEPQRQETNDDITPRKRQRSIENAD